MAFIAGGSVLLRPSASAAVQKRTSFTSGSFGVPKAVHAASVSTVSMKAEAPQIASEFAWVNMGAVAEFQPDNTYPRLVEGLDLVVVCTPDGDLYCTGNKGTPTSVPLDSGKLVNVEGEVGEIPCIQCPQYGTRYSLLDGNVVGPWIPSPPLVSNILRFLFPEPSGIPTYPGRIENGSYEVLIDVNTRERFESEYWFGLLDAKGKSTGEYY
ncbi:hypothetical protein NDN08_004417 [Rhodosorus marinus]|uniref:Rieske domain-containing protein n=1 Tax=Rhodosorus marinus TaxID=101924 RepID=A0AAV8UQF0_9RHOD|nr:hypothetical protein NDN08_004417 [Rhodosorus marinus]